MNKESADCRCLLRRALAGNAMFSTLSGIAILVANHLIVRLLGLADDVSLTVLGICLLGFAVWLTTIVRRREMKIQDAWAAVIMDVAWVVGSFVLLFVVPFSTTGKWIVAMVADVVLFFAVLQWLGIRKIRRSSDLVAA